MNRIMHSCVYVHGQELMSSHRLRSGIITMHICSHFMCTMPIASNPGPLSLSFCIAVKNNMGTREKITEQERGPVIH